MQYAEKVKNGLVQNVSHRSKGGGKKSGSKASTEPKFSQFFELKLDQENVWLRRGVGIDDSLSLMRDAEVMLEILETKIGKAMALLFDVDGKLFKSSPHIHALPLWVLNRAARFVRLVRRLRKRSAAQKKKRRMKSDKNAQTVVCKMASAFLYCTCVMFKVNIVNTIKSWKMVQSLLIPVEDGASGTVDLGSDSTKRCKSWNAVQPVLTHAEEESNRASDVGSERNTNLNEHMRSDGNIACRPNATLIEFQDRNISDISDRVLTISPLTRVDLSSRGSTLSISHSTGRERPTTLDSSCCIPHVQRIATEPAQQDMLRSNHSIPQGKTSHPIANHNHSLLETSVNEFNIADALMTLASPPRAKPGRDVFDSSKSTKNEINPFDQSSADTANIFQCQKSEHSFAPSQYGMMPSNTQRPSIQSLEPRFVEPSIPSAAMSNIKSYVPAGIPMKHEHENVSGPLVGTSIRDIIENDPKVAQYATHVPSTPSTKLSTSPKQQSKVLSSVTDMALSSIERGGINKMHSNRTTVEESASSDAAPGIVHENQAPSTNLHATFTHASAPEFSTVQTAGVQSLPNAKVIDPNTEKEAPVINLNQIAVTEESKVSDSDQIQLAIPTQMALVSTACDRTQIDANGGQGKDPLTEADPPKSSISIDQSEENCNADTKESEICNHREGPRPDDLETTAKDDVNINQIAVTEESKVSDLDQIQLANPTQMVLVSTACDRTQIDANGDQEKDPLTEADPPKSSISIDQSEENCNADAKESEICNHREGPRPDDLKTTSRDSKSLRKVATPDVEYVDLPWHTHEFTKVEPIRGWDSANKAGNAKSDMVWTDSRTCCLCHVSGDDDAGVYPTNCSEYDQIKGSGRLLPLPDGGWMHAGCAIWSSEVWENPIGGILSGATKAKARSMKLRVSEDLAH